MAVCTRVSTPCFSIEVLEREAVHHRAEHPHVVGAGALHAALLQLGAAEEVAPAHDDGDLHARLGDLGDLGGQCVDDVEVEPDLTATEHFTGELEEDSVVGRHLVPFAHTRGRRETYRPRTSPVEPTHPEV